MIRIKRVFRIEKEDDAYMEECRKKKRITTLNKTLPAILEDHKRLETENAELRAKLKEYEESQSDSSNTSNVDTPTKSEANLCPHKVSKNRCSRFFLTKGKILTVDRDFCNHCWEEQQKLKTRVISPSSPISKLYKKPELILCKGTGHWEDPLKIQARCERCKLRDFRTWVECQQEYQRKTTQGKRDT